MSTILANQQATSDLRDRLNRLTSATAALTPGAHRLLINSLNTLGDIADQVDGIDIGDWTHVHMRAMCALENMEANRLAGLPYEAWGNQLKHELAILAGLIRRALSYDEARPTNVSQTPEPCAADQVIETLAVYADQHGCDTGGGHQNTMLLAAILRRLFDLTPHHAIHLAQHAPYDERVRAASQAKTELLDRIRRDRLTAQSSAWTPQPGDAVTWDGRNGVWTVVEWEDDDTVWLRIDHGSAPDGTFLDHLASEHVSGCLVSVAELRPATTAAEVTV
ncbi:hypothetical protein [Nonomuraea sp. NPDC050643]|uniref:hypothetical protein n=1 Tax=Nonomuraea sp. NPDC050643 TaxID=3155660 RepID=UPI003406079A